MIHMSDTDMKATKNKLEQELVDVEMRIKELHASDPFNDPEYTNDNAAVDTDVREQEAHQRIQAEIDSMKDQKKDIVIALERIGKGRYGYCKRCNKEIPAKRLELIPETQYCVSCESELKQ
ncbi:hypothetical protein BH09PAT2_BH09PAT2_08390 [soil metagenome]